LLLFAQSEITTTGSFVVVVQKFELVHHIVFTMEGVNVDVRTTVMVGCMYGSSLGLVR